MSAFVHHIFVCGNQRAPGHRRGCCNPDGADRLRSELKAELKRRDLDLPVRVNGAGCLDQCEHGPVLVMYPHGIWYGGVEPADVGRIVDETIVAGRALDDLLIDDECLNNSNCRHIADQSDCRD